MMQGLFKIYEDIYNKEELWKIYHSYYNNPFESVNNARNFIEKIIRRSGKAKQNTLYEHIQDLKDKRINHIVSSYFLGIYIYNNITPIKKSINKTIDLFKNKYEQLHIDFKFIWYLICIFHDLGYYIEENKKYSSYNEFITTHGSNLKYKLTQLSGVPSLYGGIYKKYFNYRLKSSDSNIRKPDHGICGGILLYNSLKEILDTKQINNSDGNDNDNDNLSWPKDLEHIYRLSCWVILTHNIFYVQEEERIKAKIYNNEELNELILASGKPYKISLKNHGFLYLLMLVDTIEPIKKFFNRFNDLNQIEFEVVSGKNLHIKIIDNKLRKDYFDKISELKIFLNRDITINGDTLEIKIL